MSQHIFQPGAVFQGKAQGYEEFDLLLQDEVILGLRYLPRPDVEAAKATAFSCLYQNQNWQLHFAVTRWRQRESYRIFREGQQIVRSERLKLLGERNLNFADGTIWSIDAGPFGLAVRDAQGTKVAHSSPQISFVKKTSKIEIDALADDDKLLAAVLILLHLSTHMTE